MVLVLLGLIVGLLIPAFTNPRLGLSAHLVGLQAGLLLMVLALAWPIARLSRRTELTAQRLLLYSAYAIWISTVLGGIFGTSRATPIAGEGYSGSAWQEILVSAGLGTGSLAVLVAVSLLVVGFTRTGETS